MSPGQQRALRELERLHAAAPDDFDLVGAPNEVKGLLRVTVSLRLGPIETRPGGLEFMEREEFILLVPADFPFEVPSLAVTHTRFAGFPHVNWSRWLCLYQSNIEWNPADGMFGFFSRLRMWLGQAAINNMDPIDGPLHPPVHVVDGTLLPFITRANVPVQAGQSWLGLAEVEKHNSRLELAGWNDLTQAWPNGRLPALAIVLPKALPIEFPENGQGFFEALRDQGFDKDIILRYLRIAAQLAPATESGYIIMAMPMRRSPDGVTRHHIAIWSLDAAHMESLRLAAPIESDPGEIVTLKVKLTESTYRVFELTPMRWCPVLEDRAEIVRRRDITTTMSWCAGKKILILGCGALGSWMAEMVARANPKLLHLVDNGIVKPGLLVRQNYCLEDIGTNKALALAERVKTIVRSVSVQNFANEAYEFIISDIHRFCDYDLVLDCTASHLFQMKLEKNWHKLPRNLPCMVSVIVDATARHCLGVILNRNSECGIWDAYVQAKIKLCRDETHGVITEAFYPKDAAKGLFQPEPGCSDPTFAGSATDVCSLATTALNFAVEQIVGENIPTGFAISLPSSTHAGGLSQLKLNQFRTIRVGEYDVRICKSVYKEAKAWVARNRRLRSQGHETGGLLWGLWDDAVETIWVLDASGPPPDSLHAPAHFVCGVKGTKEEHNKRMRISRGACGFIGFWHTHPGMPAVQSTTDIHGMGQLVSTMGSNQRKALMLIFGKSRTTQMAGLYIYQSLALVESSELISVGSAQVQLDEAVV